MPECKKCGCKFTDYNRYLNSLSENDKKSITR